MVNLTLGESIPFNEVVDTSQELAQYEPRYKSLIQQGKELKVVNEDTKIKGISLIRELNELSDKYKKFREYLVKPIKDHVKEIESKIKPYEKTIEDIVGKDSYVGLRGQLADYETKQESIRREEEERLRKIQEAEYAKQVKKADKKGLIAPPPPPPVKVDEGKESGVSYRDDWTFSRDDVDLDKVPKNLLMLDEKKAQKMIDSGIHEIAGLKIFCKKIPIIREEKVDEL